MGDTFQQQAGGADKAAEPAFLQDRQDAEYKPHTGGKAYRAVDNTGADGNQGTAFNNYPGSGLPGCQGRNQDQGHTQARQPYNDTLQSPPVHQ